ncbi:MAG: hypothetical protein IJR59_02590, partial [Firmicutes bacterium]|nr:hypothetical protein [Bacillota bacterium]
SYMNDINGIDFLHKLCYDFEPECAFKGSTKQEFEVWRKETAAKAEKLLKFDRLSGCAFNAEKTEETAGLKYGDTAYTREHYLIDTFDKLKMPVYVLRPEKGINKAALALHPHGSNGKNGLVGIMDEDIQKNDDKLKFTYALDLLEKGYTVFCPDMLGAGSRRPISVEQPKKSDCTAVNNALMSVGLNLHGLTTYELKRAVDLIEKYGRENGIDTSDLPCLGFSGGGLASIWLAALDERIKTVYISGYFHSLRKTLLQSNFCGCNFVPNMWKVIDMDSVAMLVAPRKLYIETGRGDNLNGADGLENVYKLKEKVENVYKNIFGSDDFKFTVCDGMHRWYGAFMDEF